MANASKVPAVVDDASSELVVQGFRAGGGRESYVFIGSLVGDELDDAREVALTPENAHILSEEIRKHAEFAATPRTEEEK